MEDRNGGACEGRRGRQACGGYAGGPGIPMLRDPSVGGASGKALRAPPAGGLLENDRAERSGFVENGNKLKNSGRCPALRVPFHQLSERSREAANTCPHLT